MREIAAWRFMFGLAAALALGLFALFFRAEPPEPPDSAWHWVILAAGSGLLGLALATLATGLGLAAWFASCRALEFIADLFGLDPSARERGRSPAVGSRLPR